MVVDDEVKILDTVKLYLQKEGYIALSAKNGQEALDLFEKNKPDLIILDLMLPDISGEELCKIMREKTVAPIIMLTAKTAEEDKIKGLNMGADDYLIKPFSTRELLARVKAHLRRSKDAFDKTNTVLGFNDGRLSIDTLKHEVSVNGKKVNLTPAEFQLLLGLCSYPGRVYTRLELINRVQGYDFEGYERTIDTHIKNLRQKIEQEPKNPRFIQTVFGVGYKFEESKS